MAGYVTLIPFGTAHLLNRENCLDLLLGCGADARRIYDRRFADLEEFLSRTARLTGIDQPDLQCIVCLTETCPLVQMVLGTRRRITRRIPTLASAMWVIYVDPSLDPSFFQTAERLGEMQGLTGRAPIWEVKSRQRRIAPLRNDDDSPTLDVAESENFLVLTPDTDRETAKFHAGIMCQDENLITQAR